MSSARVWTGKYLLEKKPQKHLRTLGRPLKVAKQKRSVHNFLSVKHGGTDF